MASCATCGRAMLSEWPHDHRSPTHDMDWAGHTADPDAALRCSAVWNGCICGRKPHIDRDDRHVWINTLDGGTAVDPAQYPAATASPGLDAVTGALLHRAWLKSGRPDPLLDADAWDGFALTIRAVAEMERAPDHCRCGSFVPDSSGESGCGNCGADYPPALAADRETR